jgi:hypothetical protein
MWAKRESNSTKLEREDRVVGWAMVLLIGVLIFLFDWSGFCKWDPDLFSPKPLNEVWWHLPIEIGAVMALVKVLEFSDSDDRQRRARAVQLSKALFVTAGILLVSGLLLAPFVGWVQMGHLDAIAVLLLIAAVILS